MVARGENSATLGSMVSRRPPMVAAIPARDEAAELPACLHALADQRGRGLDAVVVCLNNCSDGSADVIRRLTPDLPFAVIAPELTLPPDRACAGEARRIAMDVAADVAGPDGILLGTDADGRVAPDWVAVNLAAMRAGAEAVAGIADIDPFGAALIPARLHDDDARENAYAALQDEIDSLIDPDPADPWPRHDTHSGASFAVTVAAYRRAGGIPVVRVGEDRAFFAALRRVDAVIRHDPAARVVVSARVHGRASGGMADTIRRRIAHQDPFIDDRLEPVTDAVRRASLRAKFRATWRMAQPPQSAPRMLAQRLRLSEADVGSALAAPHAGTGWAGLERRSPVLSRRLVALDDLPVQTTLALMARDILRARRLVRPAANPGEMMLRAAVA